MLFCVNLVPCTKQESVINIIAYKSGVKTRFEIALFLYNKTVYDEKNNFIVPKNKTKRKQNKESERYFGDRKFFSIWEKERERNFSTPFLKVYLTYPYVDWVCIHVSLVPLISVPSTRWVWWCVAIMIG
jgi:hypothetical protein